MCCLTKYRVVARKALILVKLINPGNFSFYSAVPQFCVSCVVCCSQLDLRMSNTDQGQVFQSTPANLLVFLAREFTNLLILRKFAIFAIVWLKLERLCSI